MHDTSIPSLVVFDLDFTLWDCGGTWCDCLSPPFERAGGEVQDARGNCVRLYPDVGDVLDWCDQQRIPMGLASRTQEPDWARQLIRMLDVDHRFAFAEIYPGSKFQHFAALRMDSQIDYSQMLFFDDEMRNIREIGRLGVTCTFVDKGFDRDVFDAGLRQFQGARRD